MYHGITTPFTNNLVYIVNDLLSINIASKVRGPTEYRGATTMWIVSDNISC